MTNDIIVRDSLEPALTYRAQSEKERIERYLKWSGDGWIKPDLASYRDWLFSCGLAPVSVQAHLSTVRGAYKRILKSNPFRMQIMSIMPGDNFVEIKAQADLYFDLMENAVDPINSPVPIIKKQDEVGFRLSEGQIDFMLRQIDTTTLMGIRDMALIRVMLATGIREAEATDLEVPDLFQEYEGFPSLEVREGKGGKQRMVLYGAMENWALDYVQMWLANAGIEEGYVFRGFWKGGESIRETALSTRQVQRILDQYPIQRQGQSYSVNPHDLRRTYARFCYESGMDLSAIQAQMGHSSMETTLRYIGDIGAKHRIISRSYE